MEPLKARSVAQFVEITSQLRETWSKAESAFLNPWFRGHLDAAWVLQPSLYRLELEEHEDEIRLEFRRRASQLVVEREPPNEWGWYFLMQHYGAPTRLLDWTDSALVGLFFALNSGSPAELPDIDAAVWVIDPWWLTQLSLNSDAILEPDWAEAQPYLPPVYGGAVTKALPAAIDPAHVARRLSVQRSRFVVFGSDREGLIRLADVPGSRLIKIVLPRRHLLRMRLDLATCGIVDTTVFPDLDGLSRELIRFWKTPWPL